MNAERIEGLRAVIASWRDRVKENTQSIDRKEMLAPTSIDPSPEFLRGVAEGLRRENQQILELIEKVEGEISVLEKTS